MSTTATITATRTSKNIFEVDTNRTLKPTVTAPRLSIRFVNIGDDTVKINSIELGPQKEFLFTEGDGLTIDETIYRIEFEGLFANKKLLVIETYINGFRNLKAIKSIEQNG